MPVDAVADVGTPHAPHCTACGSVSCIGCGRTLDPPRFCPDCGRRLTVTVTPGGYRARCRDHGELTNP
ncbi:MAG TPA: hypothetical protein VIH95_01755 [Acidimicrobiales bacterium]